jgi:monofunctional biosynthetic peptidoglycan transglycosylase
MEPKADMVKRGGGCYRRAVKLKPTLARIWRIAWISAVALAAIPLILAPVYRFVRPVSTLMVAAWLTGQPVDRTWVSFDDVAKVLVASVIMSEDGKFCSHHGVDWAELNQIIQEADARPRGASTLAMQTARNLFLWQGRSYLRKALEIPIALFGDLVWGKRREIEIYLNIAEWGPGIFGIEAAARHYFRVPAKSLNARQSALLAVTLPNPDARDPAHPSALMNALAATVAARARASSARPRA